MNSCGRTVWAVSKNRVCFSCQVSIKPCVQESDIQLVGLIAKDNDKDYIILNDKMWTVESTGTKLFSEILPVGIEALLDQEVEIHAFSPELLSKYHSSDNEGFKEEFLTVHFLIPKNV